MSCKAFVNGFNGQLYLREIAGPELAYTFVVPFMTQFGLLSSFKTKPNDMAIRETMKELSSMKNCFYTQLHWRKGNGNSSHVNESDWRDSQFLDPTSSSIVEGYLASLSISIGTKTGGICCIHHFAVWLRQIKQAIKLHILMTRDVTRTKKSIDHLF